MSAIQTQKLPKSKTNACIELHLTICRFKAELAVVDKAAATQAHQSRQELQRVQQEWRTKFQSEISLLQQQATASMGSTTAQHEQAFAAQQAQHAQRIQKMATESSNLLQAKQGLQAKVQDTEQLLQTAHTQVKDLQSNMQLQQHEARQVVSRLNREQESARLSLQARHSAEIVALREQVQVAMQEMQQEMLQREQQADQNYSELLGSHGILERRFNAR